MSGLLEKIDVRQVVVNHWDTLIDDRTKARLWPDFVAFYGLPIVAATIFALSGARISGQAADVMTTALSVLAGLLFNLLMLLHTLGWRDRDHPLSATVKELVSQLYSNIAYAILVSTIALVPLVVAANYPDGDRSAQRAIVGVTVVWMVTHFGLTIGMILKRIHAMLQDEFGRPKVSSSSDRR